MRSTLDARLAGKQHASAATPNIVAAEAPNAIGFCGAMPYSKAATKRVAIKAARMPKATPDIVSKILSRKTDLRTWPR